MENMGQMQNNCEILTFRDYLDEDELILDEVYYQKHAIPQAARA